MSQVFDRYDLQYCELSANLSRKCTAASALDGEKKKQKLCDINDGLDEAETLIGKMDLEARSLLPNIKATLLAKLREYKTDLNTLKSEVKRISSANTNLYMAARDELLESGDVDVLMRNIEKSSVQNRTVYGKNIVARLEALFCILMEQFGMIYIYIYRGNK